MSKRLDIGAALEKTTTNLHMERDVLGAIEHCARNKNKTMRHARLIPLVAIMILLASAVALAAGLGVFSKFGEKENADPRLPLLDDIPSAPPQSFDLPCGIHLTVERAFFTENRIFIAYSLFCDENSVLTEAEEVNSVYDTSGAYTISDSDLIEYAGDSETLEWVRVIGHAAIKRTLYLSEGLSLGDGEYASIICGEEYIGEDGTLYGWKECSLASVVEGDSITVGLQILAYDNVLVNDGTYQVSGAEAYNDRIDFEARRDPLSKTVKVNFDNEMFAVSGSIELSSFDVSGRLFVECPSDWIDEYYALDEAKDVITGWALYSGDTLISDENIVGGYEAYSENAVLYDICLLTQGNRDLKLVPVFSKSGAQPQKAITLEEG